MFWRAIKNSKLLRVPELVLPFCIRLGSEKNRRADHSCCGSEPHLVPSHAPDPETVAGTTGGRVNQKHP